MVRPFSGSSIRHETANRGRNDSLNRERCLFTIAAGSSWAALHLDGKRIDTACGYSGHVNHQSYSTFAPSFAPQWTDKYEDFIWKCRAHFVVAALISTPLLWNEVRYIRSLMFGFALLQSSGSREASNNSVEGSARGRNLYLTAHTSKCNPAVIKFLFLVFKIYHRSPKAI